MNALPLSRVIIFGANGFIGSRVSAELAARDITHIPLTSRDLDLSSASAVDHLAKLIAPEDDLLFISALTPDRGRDLHTLMKNLAMSYHLAQALASHPCRQLTYVSSDAVYTDSASFINEESPCDPHTLHGIMHITREKILAEAARQAKVPYLILRPCAVYGAGDTHNSYGPNRFVRSARETRVITLFGEGEEQREHLGIEDCAALIVRGVMARLTGTLNLATGVAHSFMDVARVIAAVSDDEIAINTTPRQGAVTHRHFDITKLVRCFPDFAFSTLEDGIRRTLQASTGAPPHA